MKETQHLTELRFVSGCKPQRALVAVLTLLWVAQAGAQRDSSTTGTGRRPVVSADYDTWRTIQSQRLSPDGRRVAYALVPQAGDAEVVVRDIGTGHEIRAPLGRGPRWNSAPALQFGPNGQYVAVQTYSGGSGATRTTGGLLIVDTRSGATVALPNAADIQLADVPSDWSAYRVEQDGTRELQLRRFSDGEVRRLGRVSEFSLTKDGQMIVYTVPPHDTVTGGVFVLDVVGIGEPMAIATGSGPFSRPTWNDDQTRLAFLSADGLAVWSRGSPKSVVVTHCASGFTATGAIPVRFSPDGQRINFGCRAATEPSARVQAAKDGPAHELWRWNDPRLPSAQKVAMEQAANQAYLSVWHVAEHRLTQIAGPGLADVQLSESGRWALGLDSRPYLGLTDYEGPLPYVDVYVIDALTGDRRLALKKHRGTISLSPDGRFALYFDGKDWHALSTQDLETYNLTARLRRPFADSSRNLPDTPPPYGVAGWSTDGDLVFLYDRFDLWAISPRGTTARNVTHGVGRKAGIALRIVPFDRKGRERAIDANRPILLHALQETTHASGFYEVARGAAGAVRQLRLDPVDYSDPLKARDADVYLLTASTFERDPDLLVTDPGFTRLQRVSEANPQLTHLLWGTTELVSYHPSGRMPLQGILYKPANFDPRKKYPMVVYIHERLSDRLFQFVPPRPEWGHAINISTYVSNGYLVLAPDITYTIGEPGPSALQCVLSAVDAIVAKGFVDEQGIGIQGHSFGGYEVAYIISHSSRFQAAEAGAVVVDMPARYNSLAYGQPAQYVYEKNQSRIGGSLWNAQHQFIANSPIFAADRIRTPVLLLHNDTDPNAPFSGGLEFYLALRRLHKEVYLFNYPGEGHDLDRWANGKDYADRMQQFFDHFLKHTSPPDWMRPNGR